MLRKLLKSPMIILSKRPLKSPLKKGQHQKTPKQQTPNQWTPKPNNQRSKNSNPRQRNQRNRQRAPPVRNHQQRRKWKLSKHPNKLWQRKASTPFHQAMKPLKRKTLKRKKILNDPIVKIDKSGH